MKPPCNRPRRALVAKNDCLPESLTQSADIQRMENQLTRTESQKQWTNPLRLLGSKYEDRYAIESARVLSGEAGPYLGDHLTW